MCPGSCSEFVSWFQSLSSCIFSESTTTESLPAQRQLVQLSNGGESKNGKNLEKTNCVWSSAHFQSNTRLASCCRKQALLSRLSVSQSYKIGWLKTFYCLQTVRRALWCIDKSYRLQSDASIRRVRRSNTMENRKNLSGRILNNIHWRLEWDKNFTCWDGAADWPITQDFRCSGSTLK